MIRKGRSSIFGKIWWYADLLLGGDCEIKLLYSGSCYSANSIRETSVFCVVHAEMYKQDSWGNELVLGQSRT
jgi:hypothetical protein